MAANDPIRLLRDIMNNFPSGMSIVTCVIMTCTVAPMLIESPVNETFRNEVAQLAEYFPAGESIMHLNSREIDMQSLDPFRYHNNILQSTLFIDLY